MQIPCISAYYHCKKLEGIINQIHVGMKNYSLVKIAADPSKQENISWASFEERMRKHRVKEAIIFAVGEDLTLVNLVKRTIISQVIVNPDKVKCWDEYCIVEHENGDRIIPCLVLLDPEIDYAVIKAIEFQQNEYVIQCRFTQPDNQFIVNKCEIETRDTACNFIMN